PAPRGGADAAHGRGRPAGDRVAGGRASCATARRPGRARPDLLDRCGTVRVGTDGGPAGRDRPGPPAPAAGRAHRPAGTRGGGGRAATTEPGRGASGGSRPPVRGTSHPRPGPAQPPAAGTTGGGPRP